MEKKISYEKLLAKVKILEDKGLELEGLKRALQKSEQSLRETQSIAHVGNWDWDLLSGEVEWSEEVYKIFGLNPGEFQPQIDSVMERFHPDDQSQHKNLIKQSMIGKKAYSFEANIMLPNNEIRKVFSTAQGRYNKEGELIRIVGIVQDISSREKIELKLLESEKKYRTLFENMAQGVFYQRADGTLSDYNENALKMFGLTSDQFLGRTFVDPSWKVIHEDGSFFPGEEHPSMVALKTGKPVLDKVAGVFNPIKNDYVWLSINAIPQFKDGEKQPYQVFVTLHDITEQKQTQDALQESEDFLNRTGDMAQVGGWEVDLKTMKVLWTRTTGRIHELPFGYFPDLEEAIGYYHPEDQDHVRQCVQRAIESAEPFDFTVRLITAKKRERWVRALG